MEPRHHPGRPQRRRRLRPPRRPPAGLQPHPPQRRRLRALRRFPLPAHDRAAHPLPGGPGRRPARRVPARLLPRRRVGPARLLLGPAQPRGRGRHRGRADGDDADRHGPLHLPPEPPRERPDRRRRQRPARRPRRSAGRPRGARNLRHRLQRPVLWAATALPDLLRRRLQPPLRRLWDLAARPARPRLHRGLRHPGTGREPSHQRRRRGLRDLRHRPQPGGPGPGGDLLRQRRGRPRQPRRRGPRSGLRHGGVEGAQRLERRSGAGPRQRRPAPPPRHLLHRAVPRPAGAADLQRRRRRLPRHGRGGPLRPRPHPVRRLLRLGHLPQRGPAALAADPQARRRHDALAARRRRTERLPAALALRRRAEHDDGRRLRRPDPRLRRGLRRRRLRPPRGPGGDGEGSERTLPQRQRRIPGAPGPRRVRGARLHPLRPRHQHPQRELDLRRSRSRLGLGRDHAGVRGRRLLDRPVRGPLARRSRHLRRLHAPLGELAAPVQSRQLR